MTHPFLGHWLADRDKCIAKDGKTLVLHMGVLQQSPLKASQPSVQNNAFQPYTSHLLVWVMDTVGPAVRFAR